MRRAILLIAALAGCATSSDRREALTDALLGYTRGLRWGQPDWLKPYLPKTATPGFDPAAAPPGLQLVTCDIDSVTLAPDAQRAAVQLKLEWYLVEQGRMYSTVLEQTWRLDEDRWEIIGQRTLRGAPFPPRPARLSHR